MQGRLKDAAKLLELHPDSAEGSYNVCFYYLTVLAAFFFACILLCIWDCLAFAYFDLLSEVII